MPSIVGGGGGGNAEGEVGRGTWLMLGDGAHILDLQRLASLLSIITLTTVLQG